MYIHINDNRNFDGEDNYAERRDGGAYLDKWMEGLGREEMRRARAAEEARQVAMINSESNSPSRESVISQLAILLREGETPTQALQSRNAVLPVRRIGQKPKGPLPTEQQLHEHKTIRQEIEMIADCATRLIDMGMLDIYDTAKERIL